jgi:branched-chain amino acid transport system permease protein
MIYKSSGLMSFMQGDMLTLGGFVGYTFYALLRLPFIAAFLCTAVFMMFLGFSIEKFVIRKMINIGINTFYVVLATIAGSFIIQNGIQRIWGTKQIAFPSIFNQVNIRLLGRSFKPEAFLCLFVSILIMVILQIFLNYTKFGVAMRAAALDKTAAKACGINVNLSTGMAWGIASSTAALAGILVAPIYSLYSTLGSNIGTKGFAAAVIGGFGNIYGAIVGGFILGLGETFVSGYISSTYKDLVAYTVLLIFLFVKPFGIFNEKTLAD